MYNMPYEQLTRETREGADQVFAELNQLLGKTRKLVKDPETFRFNPDDPAQHQVGIATLAKAQDLTEKLAALIMDEPVLKALSREAERLDFERKQRRREQQNTRV